MNNNIDIPAAANRIRLISWVLLALLPIAALGTRLQIWHFSAGLILLAVSMLGSLLVQMINAIWLLRKPNAGTKRVLRLTSVIALPPLLAIAAVIRTSGSGAAMIHNISTDINNPPVFVAANSQRDEHSNPLAYTAEIAAAQRQSYPDVAPIYSLLSPSRAFAHALTIAEELDWQVYDQTKTEGRIEAVDTTFWLGFKDDIVIRVTPDEKGSRIDLRSVSRVGRSDLGANANRILTFTQRFNQSASH